MVTIAAPPGASTHSVTRALGTHLAINNKTTRMCAGRKVCPRDTQYPMQYTEAQSGCIAANLQWVLTSAGVAAKHMLWHKLQ